MTPPADVAAIFSDIDTPRALIDRAVRPAFDIYARGSSFESCLAFTPVREPRQIPDTTIDDVTVPESLP